MNSKIILAKNINIDKGYKNVLSYSNSDMLSLINNVNNKIAESDKFSFIRHENSLFVDFTYEQCLQATYIAFQNPDYSNKWFFAFVDDIVYKGNKNTEIIFTVDAWSTWFENLTVKQCFVERHHVNNDTIGLNTISENINTGIPYQIAEQHEAGLSDYHWVAALSSWNPATKKQFDGITIYNNITYGKEVHLFQAMTQLQLENLLLYLIDTNADSHIADISDIFIVPYSIVDAQDLTAQTGSVGGHDYTFYKMPFSDLPKIIPNTVTKPYTFSDYQPKNNKALCYPYNYLLVSNNVGNYNIYKYEDFSTTNATFDIELALSIGCSGRLIPKYYRNMERDVDESIPLAKYPICGWSTDSFVNWLTQQSVNLATQTATTIVGTASSLATPTLGQNATQFNQTGISPAISFAGSVGSIIGAFYSAELAPNIEGGQNTGDVNFSAKGNTFTYRKMRCKAEYLKIVDDYFTRFGYKINRVITPNITGRRNFNYVEIGKNEEIGYGDIPNKYMDIINNICRSGVTIWHNNSNVGDYSVNNDII